MTSRTTEVDYLLASRGKAPWIRRSTVVASPGLSIFEPPRFFEALLRGRSFGELRTSPPGSAASARLRIR